MCLFRLLASSDPSNVVPLTSDTVWSLVYTTGVLTDEEGGRTQRWHLCLGLYYLTKKTKSSLRILCLKIHLKGLLILWYTGSFYVDRRCIPCLVLLGTYNSTSLTWRRICVSRPVVTYKISPLNVLVWTQNVSDVKWLSWHFLPSLSPFWPLTHSTICRYHPLVHIGILVFVVTTSFLPSVLLPNPRRPEPLTNLSFLFFYLFSVSLKERYTRLSKDLRLFIKGKTFFNTSSLSIVVLQGLSTQFRTHYFTLGYSHKYLHEIPGVGL